MKKLSLSLLSISLLALSACSTAPTTAMAPVHMNAQSAPITAQYSFRKPQGSITFRFNYGSERVQGMETFREFMRKYVDKNDIFNYQTIEKSCSGDYCVTFNIFGGQKDFVKKMLSDARYYVRQRVEVESASIQ